MIRGRVWKFPANINTDLILPGPFLRRPEAEQSRAVFSANRPGWAGQVEPGDILVAGANFGTGSSRPAARALRGLGIACVLADSLNGLFFRNSVNYGLLALNVPGVSGFIDEGGIVEIRLDSWSVRNATSGAVLAALPVAHKLLSIMNSGGIFPVLERNGLIGPAVPVAAEPRVITMHTRGEKA